MVAPERKIIILNLLAEGPVSERSITFGGIRFQLTEHLLGWDVETAVKLIQKYDGYADGIALSGLNKQVMAGRASFVHPVCALLMREARKTPIYASDDVRGLFADWSLQKVLKEQPQFFFGRKVLFHCAIASPFLPKIEDAGGIILATDALMHPGLPWIIRGSRKIEAFVRGIRLSIRNFSQLRLDPKTRMAKGYLSRLLQKAIRDCDIFVTSANLLEMMPSLEALSGKALIIDFLTDTLKARLELAPPVQIIEFSPEHPELQTIGFQHFSVMAALIDQLRLLSASHQTFEEFFLRWIQKMDVKPKKLRTNRGLVRRCAFVIHPLSRRQLWKNSGLPWIEEAMEKVPSRVQRLGENLASHYPVFRYGRVEGIVSRATGQEVVCDLYALAATPRQIMNMDEEFLYGRLVKAADLARRHGSLIMGLGAYTKVAGDAGLTVSRRAPLPVTNGNSYSASATMWAARVMVERMSFVKASPPGEPLRAKAMIIGATGSIGRVSAMLAALAFEELVLVATRADKLLEVRQEIQEMFPRVSIKVTTNPNADLVDMDLIVTATSNQSGSILDIDQVKPGAVICDCSRPVDITPEDADRRPDVMVIESGEILLPGNVRIVGDIGLPKPSVYACLAETALLALDGRFESFSLSKQLSLEKVKEIYRIGIKHGAKLSEICGPSGAITESQIERCRMLAVERLQSWPPGEVTPKGLAVNLKNGKEQGEENEEQNEDGLLQSAELYAGE
jgi:predicted amino acid dehydrogenase